MRNYFIVLIFLMGLGSLSFAASDYFTVEQAQKLFFKSGTVFVPHSLSLTSEQIDTIRRKARVSVNPDRIQVWEAMSGNTSRGWFFVDNVIGKHDYITYAVGISPTGNVVGVTVLTYRETHGKQIANPNWLAQFLGKTLRDPFKIDQDIDGISGATLSVRNVTDGVKKLLVLKETAL